VRTGDVKGSFDRSVKLAVIVTIITVVVSFLATLAIVALAFRDRRATVRVILSLLVGVFWTVGLLALMKVKLNFLNFIALPITFGIGCEYPFNVYDRSRLLGGDVTAAVKRVGGAVALCSFTTCDAFAAVRRAMSFSSQSVYQVASQPFGNAFAGGGVTIVSLGRSAGSISVPPAASNGNSTGS